MFQPVKVSRSHTKLFMNLLSLILKYKRDLVSVSLLGAASAVSNLVIPRYITQFFSGGVFRIPGAPVVIGLVLLIVLSGILSVVKAYSLQGMGEDLVYDVRCNLSDHLLRLPIGEYARRGAGDLLSRLSSDTAKLKDSTQQIISAVASDLVLVIGSLLYMLAISPVLLCVTVILLLAVLSLILLSSSFVEKASYSNQRDLGVMTSIMNRDLAGIRTIRAANAVDRESSGIRNVLGHVRQSGMKLVRTRAVVSPIANIGLELLVVGVLGLGLWLVSTGQMQTEVLVQFVTLVFITLSPLSQIVLVGSQIGESLAALSRIEEILDIQAERDDEIQSSAYSSAETLTTTGSSAIEFSQVSFSYDSEEASGRVPFSEDDGVLHNLNLNVKRGSFVALVGPSGAGKSTVLQLIERFYEPQEGSISVLGKNIAEYNREELRSHLAYVEQNSPILSGSLRDNLLIGDANASDEACRKVLHEVNLGHLLDRSEAGLGLKVGESGTALSGGERQRLAIARALLSKAKVVLLDEATSNLDGQNERHIMQLLSSGRDSRDRTFIFVAHRLASITDADEIHVFSNGGIIGSGSHAELVERVPLYRNLAREQHLI